MASIAAPSELRPRLYLGGCVFVVALVLLLQANDVRLVWRLSQIGKPVDGIVVSVHPQPTDSRAYTSIRYSYAGAEFSGTLRGADSYRVGGSVPLTVDPSNPSTYWEGAASPSAVRRLVFDSAAGAFLLALATSIFARIPWRQTEAE